MNGFSLLSIADANDKKGIRHAKGFTGSAPAFAAASVAAAQEGPLLYVAHNESEARRCYDEARSFLPPARVAFLPSLDESPYEGIRGDRAVLQKRAATLALLQRGSLDFVATSALSWVRKTSSAQLLREGTILLKEGEAIDTRGFALHLERAGYENVVLVEDPGTFALRGEIIDVWPPHLDVPLRLTLEFDVLRTARFYNPETQMSEGASGSFLKTDGVYLPPAREAVVTQAGMIRAETILRSLTDHVSLPSSKARLLIDDVKNGRMFLSGSAYLPALGSLVGLSAHLPDRASIVLDDPIRILETIQNEVSKAHLHFQARPDEAHFPPSEHYLSEAELKESTRVHHTLCFHRNAISGSEDGSLQDLAIASPDCASCNTEGHEVFVQSLITARKERGPGAGLDLLVEKLESWLDEGLTVVLSAHSQTRADRLKTLLTHRGLKPGDCKLHGAQIPRPGLYLTVSPLCRGFKAGLDAFVLLSDEEVFGQRIHQRRRKVELKDALDDLRQLKVGDFVVHVEHGIGQYQGLTHHRSGEMAVDLLAIEYLGGDKLLLPVYRLNQVQKFTGDSQPRLDRLGGQSFSREKSKVKKRVRMIADNLLRVYAERKELTRPPVVIAEDEYAAFESAFPFDETDDQAAAISDVLGDLKAEQVMDRLVCGDVGFGKTEVALRAAFVSAYAGRQVALLCPTTILAEQHLRTFERRFESTGAVVRGLSRFQSKKSQLATLQGLKEGGVDIVIGTHRLLSRDVHFNKLGLLIIDEEQRFGVAHKERLKELRRQVDVLTLTATPIPRTLNLSIAGMRDMSIIQTPPPNRRSIRTLTSRFDERVITEAIDRELSRGGQIYYVHNRVEGIYERAALLKRLVPDAKIAVGHGQMSESELERTMLGFVRGDFDILCATSIIESGLDIPRANTMIIDRADLFGLAQLYQIRGRVGRSSERAYCYLLVPPDARISEDAKKRIEALERYSDLGSGFHVATMDMEIRGAGELLGADQSGLSSRVGFELFSQMLAEASAELRGTTITEQVDPELSIDVAALLPDDYVADIGSRLSLYKRYASAQDETGISRLNQELEDRFGAPPDEARRFCEVMLLKTQLRPLRALGLSATATVATLHLKGDTPLTGQVLVPLLGREKRRYSLTPDGRLTRRETHHLNTNGLQHATLMLHELNTLLENP